MKRNLHIVPLFNGWAVTRAGSNKATMLTFKQSEAITYARQIAIEEGIALVIHGRNGKVRMKKSYA